MKNTFLAIGLIFTLCLLSCNVNTSNINEESEKIDAEKITEQLYSYINTKDFIQAESLFSEHFFSVTSKARLQDIFQKAYQTLGKYEERKLLEWRTSRVVGSNSKSEYFFVYEVKYQKFKAKETIVMQKEGSVIRIVSYNISSDGFLNAETKKRTS